MFIHICIYNVGNKLHSTAKKMFWFAFKNFSEISCVEDIFSVLEITENEAIITQWENLAVGSRLFWHLPMFREVRVYVCHPAIDLYSDLIMYLIYTIDL